METVLKIINVPQKEPGQNGPYGVPARNLAVKVTVKKRILTIF